MVRRIFVFMLLTILSAVLSGCSEQVFVEKNPEKVLERYSKTELEDGGFYIKDGTGFYKPYLAENDFSSTASTSSNARILWMEEKEDKLIPILYKGEVLAYVSSASTPSVIRLERLKDCGYSVGIRGFTPIKSGQLLQYTTSIANLKEGSNAYELFNGINAQKLTIADVDGSSVGEPNFTYGGVLTDMEYGKTYSLGIYVGSFYKEHKVIADTKILASDSIRELDSISLTRNGYYAVQIPEDMDSGYYYADKYGLFKYVNVEKSIALKMENINWNTNLQTTENDHGMVKTVNVIKEIELTSDYESLTIKIQSYANDKVINSATIILPNGEEEKVLSVDGSFSHMIQNAVKGIYQVKFNATGVATDYSVISEPIGEKMEEETPLPEDNSAQGETSESSEQDIIPSTNEASQSTQSTPQYEWVVKYPEPLNEAEISDTQATE